MAFINPPAKIPFFLRLGIWIARKISGAELLPARLLAWYPKAAVSSAVLEGLIAHHEANLDARLLKLVRLTVSYVAVCPFCINMNSAGWEQIITLDEMAALQGRRLVDEIDTFTPKEKLAIQYARLITSTPLGFPPAFVAKLKDTFTERDIVILATTAAQVNYWTRLIQALGCPPEGTSSTGLYLDIPER